MLILERKMGERFRIGKDIWVSVIERRRDGKIKIGIEAPKDIPIVREELIQRESREEE